MMTIREIAEDLNQRAEGYEIGRLQEIRKELKQFSRRSGRDIFSSQSIKQGFAFHHGGRKELQFNIGWDGVDGGKRLRYGAAFSLEPSESLHESDLFLIFKPKINRFNEYVRQRPGELDGFRIWAYTKTDPSLLRGPRPVREIPEEWVCTRPPTFIAVGRTTVPECLDYDEILHDFDRLLPVYRYVEDG